MSKFDELCGAYKTSREKYFAYRDESYSFAQALVGGYINYLEVPKEQFKFIPLDKDPEKNTTYTLLGAIHLADDAHWHLGFQIILYSEPNAQPQQPVLIKFMFKKVGDRVFNVKISEDDSGHEIDASSNSDFEGFFDFLQRQIKNHFENSLQDFLEESAPLRTIGFIQGR